MAPPPRPPGLAFLRGSFLKDSTGGGIAGHGSGIVCLSGSLAGLLIAATQGRSELGCGGPGVMRR